VIGKETEAEILRLFHAEKWRIGTIVDGHQDPRPDGEDRQSAAGAVHRSLRSPVKTWPGVAARV
jgi:hypothetical protein